MFAVLFCPRWRPSDVLLDAACAHVRVHSVLHLGALSLLHQTGQNKMSTEYCHNKIAVVCFHIKSLQSQQAFCFFLGLRAVWVVPFMQLWPNQARLTRCLSEYIYIHPEMDKSHIGGVLHRGRSSWSWSGCLMSAKGFFFFVIFGVSSGRTLFIVLSTRSLKVYSESYIWWMYIFFVCSVIMDVMCI